MSIPTLPASPLNEENLQQITQALETIRVGLEHVALAKSAGIDVKAQEDSLRASQAQLLRIKQVYFPGR